MRPVQTMGDARAARSEMKGAMSGEEQALGGDAGAYGEHWTALAHADAYSRLDESK